MALIQMELEGLQPAQPPQPQHFSLQVCGPPRIFGVGLAPSLEQAAPTPTPPDSPPAELAGETGSLGSGSSPLATRFPGNGCGISEFCVAGADIETANADLP